jgi:hypothetical protein
MAPRIQTDVAGPAPLKRPVAALILSALYGAFLSGVAMLLISLIDSVRQGDPEVFGMGIAIAFLVGTFSLPVWAVGLVVIGIPGWILLHAFHVRTRWAGTVFGGVVTLVATAPFAAAAPGLSVALAAVGGVVGWSLVSIAYGEAAP